MKIFKQSSVKIDNIYIDPYLIDEEYQDARLIFITHSHYDHFSIEDIRKVYNDKTVIIGPKDVINDLLENGYSYDKLVIVEPNQEYIVDGISFETTYAYNINKKYHPKANGWVGYLINIGNIIYYFAGDTDNISELQNIKCDIAFVPIGGTYTMDEKQAAKLINDIKPQKVIPVHYGHIVGSKNLGNKFAKLVNPGIDVEKINCF